MDLALLTDLTTRLKDINHQLKEYRRWQTTTHPVHVAHSCTSTSISTQQRKRFLNALIKWAIVERQQLLDELVTHGVHIDEEEHEAR